MAMEPNKPSPTYAENLLFAAGFTFSRKEETLLRGEPLNIHLPRIAQVDIESIVKNVDIELLSSFLEDIAFCDITEDDMKLHSDKTYVKLFQLCQLIIEYQLDVTDTLSANVNGLAKKYSAKKREIEKLSNSLTKCDEEIATLKDELYHQNKCMRENMINTKASTESEQPVARIDASQYPSQERRPTTAPSTLEEMSSTESSTNASASAGSNNEICLHIVSSSHGFHLQMTVSDDLTILNLQNKLASRMLLLGKQIDFEAHSLYYKDTELNDSSLSLKQCQIGNNAALVLMPQRQPSPPSNDEEKEEQVVEVVTSNVESKLDEILLAVRALSSQDDNGSKQQLSPPSKLNSPLSKLNMQELVETEQSDCAESVSSKNVESSSYSGEETMNPSDSNESNHGKDNQGKLIVDTSAAEVCCDNDGKVSPFNPPSEIELTSKDTSEEDYLPHKKMKDGVGECNGACETLASSSLLRENSLGYSVSESQLDYTNSVKSIEAIEEVVTEELTPTPAKGFLSRDIPHEEVKMVDMSDSEIRAMWQSQAVQQPSSETKSDYSSFHGEAQQFTFSDFESFEKDEEGRINADETIKYPNEDINADDIPNLQISSAKRATMESASDMQSIEISFSEFVPNNVEEKVEEEDDGGNANSRDGNKIMRCFSFLKKNKKQRSTKKMMKLPKWKKPKKEGNIQGGDVEV